MIDMKLGQGQFLKLGSHPRGIELLTFDGDTGTIVVIPLLTFRRLIDRLKVEALSNFKNLEPLDDEF